MNASVNSPNSKKKETLTTSVLSVKKNIIFGGSSLGVMRKSWIQKHLPNFFASHLRHRISETGSGFWANVAPEATANDNGKLFFHGCHTKWTIKRIWTTTKTKKMQFSTATCHVLKKKTLAGINPGKKKHGCVSQMGLIGKDGMHLRSMVVLRSINSWLTENLRQAQWWVTLIRYWLPILKHYEQFTGAALTLVKSPAISSK